jgi:erythronate-4-phosphate dehydrogenase
MVRIVADHKIPFLRGVLDRVARVEYLPGGEITRMDVADADALITRTLTKCNRALLEGTNVSFIASATIGYDHIDTAFCREAGIGWTNAPGCNASSVQQYVVSSLLYLAHRHRVALEGKTIGIIGVGNVGSRVVRAAEILGMNTLLNDPPRARSEGQGVFVDLDMLLERSDVVTLHVPLITGGEDNTRRMVNDSFIERLRPGAVLINTSRGGVVDEQALIRGILSGRLKYVVLDVFDNEPDINIDLLDAITLATPHIAGYSLDGKANGTGMAVRAVSRFFNLGLDYWQPDRVPLPSETGLRCHSGSLPRDEMLWEIYRKTYDISLDDKRLRSDPRTFEMLRGAYPVRREPGVYTVNLDRDERKVREILAGLGFNIEN